MTETAIAYEVKESQAVPRDLFNFWRRVLKLPRGQSLLVSLKLREDGRITWTIFGNGKEENEG